MQCIGYGPVPCPPFSCCDAWWTLTVNAVSPWHTSVLIHASIEVRPSPMAPAFHSPCSSALAFCCEVVYVHSDSSVVWASTGFLSVSIVTPQRVLWNWLWPLPISRVCPTTRRVCLVTQSDLRAFGCPYAPLPASWRFPSSPPGSWSPRQWKWKFFATFPHLMTHEPTESLLSCSLLFFYNKPIIKLWKNKVGFCCFIFLTKCVSVIKLFCGEDNLTRFYFITRDPSYWLYLS